MTRPDMSKKWGRGPADPKYQGRSWRNDLRIRFWLVDYVSGGGICPCPLETQDQKSYSLEELREFLDEFLEEFLLLFLLISETLLVLEELRVLEALLISEVLLVLEELPALEVLRVLEVLLVLEELPVL